ncbi:MAG: sugar phosphate isomerase/epimerase [Phycisphaerae bacterium]|nr:sugar phosphate isomerase/epimerase [Phycisphaerae bacterium]
MFRTNRLSLGVLTVLAGLTMCQSVLAAEECGRWKLSMQVYTFNRYTLFEAIDKCKELGIKYVELFPGQRLSPDKKNIQFSHGASAEYRKMVKDKLAEAGIKAVGYGVVGLGKDEAENRKVFDFCKDMGIGVINSEPSPEDLPAIDKLAQEYNISVGLHNHPQPSRYWNYKAVLEATKNCSKRIGACADTGHWMRSGIVPLEAVKALKGRIVSSHLKDLNKMGRPGEHDVPWGTGKGDVRGVLEELKKQGYTGIFSIEYEHNWTTNMPELAKCVEWFNKTTEEIYGAK